MAAEETAMKTENGNGNGGGLEKKKTAGVDDSTIMKGGEGEKAADFANYFVSYAYLYHQKQMLTDHRRMAAYHQAIMANAEVIKGKTVLDVGTGTGVLAVWAAKAGAKKVYAVEFTDMAKHARTIVEKNGVSDIVEVIQGSAEDLEIDGQGVDIIVSEWMGYFLLRESMLDSLLRVREKYLKPDGSMFPSHATMYISLVNDEVERSAKENEYYQAIQDWISFTYETRQHYGLDLAGLSEQYETEQKKYYLLSSAWAELRGDQVIGEPVKIYHLDLKTCTFEQVKGVPPTNFIFEVKEDTRVSGFATWFTIDFNGFAGWFTTDFDGSPESPLPHPTILSTAPEVGYTHWGQQVFHLVDPLDLSAGDRIEGSFEMMRQVDNARLYDVVIAFYVIRGGVAGQYVSHRYQMP